MTRSHTPVKRLSLIVAIVLLFAPVLAKDAETLRSPEVFSSIENVDERSQALFDEMAKVITHPRCINCHPRSDTPTQGNAMTAHHPPVVRGPDGFGVGAMRCASCHGDENVAFAGASGSIPGNSHWHLAPLSMGWAGMTHGEICEQLKDPDRNGDRSLSDLITHHAQDVLVGWAWNPGEGRDPAPGNQELFAALTLAWIETGAVCPD